MANSVMQRVVVITGGTSGIGLAVAELFLKAGEIVVLIGLSAERGLQAVDLLSEYGEVDFVSGDVSCVAECKRLIEVVTSKYERLDVLINSAGIYRENPIDDVSEAEFDEIMNVNIKGTYFMCQAATPYLKRSGKNGAVVNVSSDAGVNGNFFCTAYCASKGAVTVFTKALALELAPHGVRVNCVCPGDIMTPLTEAQLSPEHREAELQEMIQHYPLGRLGTAQEAAEVIFFLASAKAGFVAGAVWGVDGGITAY